jgi:Na+/H+-dicarboxylate symporter
VTFSTKVLVGLVSGLVTGLFLGEMVAPVKVIADGFIKLLQMTVLPYVTISIIASLGSLDAEEAKRLGLRAGAVMVGLWIVALGFAMLFPLAFPSMETATFFSTSMIEKRPPFNFVDLYIPSNPFHSLANGVVPAVVLFAVVLGIAMIGLERKQVLLDVLSVANGLVSRATRFVVQLTPYGMFAIAANAAGTLKVEQLQHIQVYLLTYVAISMLVALWVLPGLVSTLTPIGYREVLGGTRAALITAFMAGDLFIVLPILIEGCKDLLAKHHLTDEHTAGLPDVIVPASFNFPHTGKLLSVSFILFAAWFADVALELVDYPRLALTGLLTFFGSLNAAVPFLLDMFRIPADTFQLYLATGVINARFGALLAALHTVAVALLGSAAITGRLRVDPRRLLRFVIVTVVLTAATIGGLRTLFSTVLRQEFQGAQIVYGMDTVFPPVDDVRILTEVPSGEPTAAGPDSHANVIRHRGALRVCVLPNRIPYAYTNAKGTLTGLDVEMAHRLARDLVVRLEFVQVELEQLPQVLDAGGCDLAMSGTPVTPLRASRMLFSQPYLDETLAWVVKDHLRDKFSTWEAIRELGPMRVGAPDLPYYLQAVRERAPALQIETVTSPDVMELFSKFDAFLLPAERGSVATLVRPDFTVVVPEPGLIKVPLAYPMSRHDDRWEAFVNTWVELKRRDGTIDKLYRHWILGQDAVKTQPRWSVVRNVLHWVD